MSFSSEVKKELCGVPFSCCALAESCGVLLYAGSFSSNELRIVTESAEFAKRIPKLFQQAFGMETEANLEQSSGGGKHIFHLLDTEKLQIIWNALGYDPAQHFALHVNFALLEESDSRSAFLRGAFLAGGSVTDPRKRYHLELLTAHLQVSRETDALLADMGFEPKSAARGGSGVTYFKNSRDIRDLLTMIGAPSSAMEIVSARAEKSMRNAANRRVNCDAANLDKAVDASRAQVEALTRLAESGAFRTLSEGLQEVAVARLLQPELTLSELACTFDPPLTKSCLNHRMRKLMRLAKEERV